MSNIKRQKNMTYKERQGISYQPGADPPFIAKMKEKVGYKEWTIEDKFVNNDEDQEIAQDPDILDMREEDRPQIVVIDPEKNLTAEQVNEEIIKKRGEEDKRKILEGKITFKKPEKRACEESSGTGNDKEDFKRKRIGNGEKLTKLRQPVKDKRLLSFNDQE